MKLSDFLSSIGEAGYEAAKVARKSAEKTLFDSLKVNPDNPSEMVFKRINVRLPGPTLENDDGILISIPRYGMLTGGNLDLDVLKVSLEADIDDSELPEPKKDSKVPANDINLSLRKNPFGRASGVKVEMEFRMSEPPEFAEQLRDKLTTKLKEQLNTLPILLEDDNEEDSDS